MYSIKVKAAATPRPATASYASVAGGGAGGSASGSQPTTPAAARAAAVSAATAAAAAAAASPEEQTDHVSFSAGNPRVEHMVGRVHLYRHLPPPGAAPPAQSQTAQPQRSGDAKQKQPAAAAGSFSSEIEPALSADDLPAEPAAATAAAAAAVGGEGDLPVCCCAAGPCFAKWNTAHCLLRARLLPAANLKTYLRG
jgi:BRCA1-associated protein